MAIIFALAAPVFVVRAHAAFPRHNRQIAECAQFSRFATLIRYAAPCSVKLVLQCNKTCYHLSVSGDLPPVQSSRAARSVSSARWVERDEPLFISALRDGPSGARSGARAVRRHPHDLQESDESDGEHRDRQKSRGGGGTVRAHDPPLWQAGFRSRRDIGRRGRGGDHRGDRLGKAVLPAVAFQA